MRCIAALVLVLFAAGSAVPDAAAQEPGVAPATGGRYGTFSALTITTSADLQCMLLLPPMHPAVPILPGLMTLRPKSADWLPSVVDLEAIPWAQPQEIVTPGDGGTMEGLVRREIGNRVLLMYGFNGQYPGPLLRVSEKATIFVNLRSTTVRPDSLPRPQRWPASR